jgi:hypothetical protein
MEKIDLFGSHVSTVKRDVNALCDLLEKAIRRVDDATVGAFPRAAAATFVLAALEWLPRDSPSAVAWSFVRPRCEAAAGPAKAVVPGETFAAKFLLAYGAQVRAMWQDSLALYESACDLASNDCEEIDAWCGAASVWPKLAVLTDPKRWVDVGLRFLARELADDIRASIKTLLGRMMHVSGDLVGAEEQLRESIGLRPGDTGTLRFLANVLLDQDHDDVDGRFKEACELLENVRTEHKKSVDILMDLADAYSKRRTESDSVEEKRTYVAHVMALIAEIMQIVNEKSIVGRRSHICERCASILRHCAGDEQVILQLVDGGLAALQFEDPKRIELAIRLCDVAFQVFQRKTKWAHTKALKYAWIMVRMVDDEHRNDERVIACADFIATASQQRVDDWSGYVAQLPERLRSLPSTKEWLPHLDLAELIIWQRFDFDRSQVLRGRVPVEAKSSSQDDLDDVFGHIRRALKLVRDDAIGCADVGRVVSFIAKDFVDLSRRLALSQVVASYRRVWEAVKGGKLLYRAEYQATDLRDGIKARDPNANFTAEQHIDSGSRTETQWVSFTLTLPVAVMHWARAKVSETRHLVAVDPTDFLFRIRSCEVPASVGVGSAQARSTTDREVVVVPVDSLPVCFLYEIGSLYADDASFRVPIDRSVAYMTQQAQQEQQAAARGRRYPAKVTSYSKFVEFLVDVEQQEHKLEKYRQKSRPY